jgi:hypothetical protein
MLIRIFNQIPINNDRLNAIVAISQNKVKRISTIQKIYIAIKTRKN